MKYLPDALVCIGMASLWLGLWIYEPWVAYAVCGALLVAGGLRAGR